MWFKNIRAYRFTRSFLCSSDVLETALANAAFTPCGSQDLMKYGWVSPLGNLSEQLVYAAQGVMMICAKKEEKVIPSTMIKEKVSEKVAELVAKEARNVGRKERIKIKEEVVFSLLPKALSKTSLIHAYIDPKKGWLVTDAASAPRAEEFLSALRAALGTLSLVPFKCQQDPESVMTQWLLDQMSKPDNLAFGAEAELSDHQEGGVVLCKRQNLTSAEIQGHLAAGMQVTKLALIWRDGVEFLLDDQLALKRVKFLDSITDLADVEIEVDSSVPLEQFAAEFSVMTFELGELLNEIAEIFGGVDESVPNVDEVVVAALKNSEQDAVKEV